MFVVFLWGTTIAPVFAYVLPFKNYPKLEINGNNTMSLNYNAVSGSQSYYSNDNINSNSVFTQSSSLYLTGALYKDLYINATLAASQAVPGQTRWNLRYDGKDAKVQVGQFAANVGGNEFVSLNRSLEGVQVDAVLPKGQFTAVASELQSQVRTDTFYGRNVSGPYYLNASPIVDGSEVVMIDDARKERQKDYTLDYARGELDFNATTIVAPTQRITVSYEVASASLGGGGQLYAVGGSYPISDKLTVGLTHLALIGKGTGDSQESKREQFLGNGTVGPFYLTYRPLVPSSTVRVMINGVLSTANGAYIIDYTTGKLQFATGFEPPMNATITVEYNVTVSGGSSNDSSVTGMQMNWQAAPWLGLAIQAAKSSGPPPSVPGQSISNEALTLQPASVVPVTSQTVTLNYKPIVVNSETLTVGTQTLVRDVDYKIDYTTGKISFLNAAIPTSATGNTTVLASYRTEAVTQAADGNSAMEVTANMGHGRLSGMVRYRKVDAGFAPLTTVGGQTTQQTLDWNANYSPNDILTFSTNWSTSRQPYSPYATNQTSQAAMVNTDKSFNIDFHKPNWPTIALRHAINDSYQSDGNDVGSSATSDTLTTSWLRNAISASLMFNRTVTDSRQYRSSSDPYASYDPNTSDPVYSFKGITDNGSLNLGYHPTDKLDLNMNLAASKSSSSDGTTPGNLAKSIQTNATYRLTKNLSLHGGVTNSTTNAGQTIAGAAVSAQTTQNSTIGAEWRATNKLSLSTDYTTDKTSGTDLSNSTSSTLSTNANWQPFSRLSLNSYWYHQNLKYLDAGSGSSSNNMIGVGSEIGPLGKIHVSLDLQHIWGSNSVQGTAAMQALADSKRLVQTLADTANIPAISGNNSTTLSAKVTYPITKRQDIFVNGEMSSSGGYPTSSSKDSLGVGWNYHISNNLMFTLNASEALAHADAGSSAAAQDYRAKSLNAQFSWNF